MEFLELLLFGFAGLFAHWLKQWSRGECEIDFITYMKGERKHSIAAVTTLFGTIVAMYSTSDVEITKQTIATVFLAGFAINSTINKSPE